MTMWPLIFMGLFAVMAAVCAGVLWQQYQQDERMARRVRTVRSMGRNAGSGNAKSDEDGDASPIGRVIGRLGAVVAGSGLLPAATVKDLEATLVTAGMNGRNSLGVFIGCKLLAAVFLPLVGWFMLPILGFEGMWHMVGTAILLIAGLLGPDWVIRWRRKQHLNAVDLGLPDALDMMVICAEAGLPLEAAITRVGREVELAHPAVSLEFLQTASEMRIVPDHRRVLTQFGNRTGLNGCKRLATTLVQTIQYGTPLVDALRILAAEMRQEMLTRFEARAARLPVLLTLPMIVFILPCVFLVVGGPAIIQVIRVFKG